MIRNTILAIIVAVAIVLPAQAQAKAMPKLNPSLKAMLSALPIASGKDTLIKMTSALKKTRCGGGLKDCYMTKSGKIQLYFFTSANAQQTFLIVLDKKIAMPTLLKPRLQKVLKSSSLNDPIIAISTTDVSININRMPHDLKAIISSSYFGVDSLSFSSGIQLMAQIKLSGAMKKSMNTMGISGDKFTLRAGVVLPIPADFGSGLSSGAERSQSKSLKEGMDDAADIEAYVEFQLAPKQVIQSMMQTGIKLSDAIITISNAGILSVKGNADFNGLSSNKKMPLAFTTPTNPAGAIDLIDFEFRIATPKSFTLEDYVYITTSFASTAGKLNKYGGGFIGNIRDYKKSLKTMTKPLSVFALKNPLPPKEYKFGNSKYPFPSDKYFNVVLLGPLADGGPLLKVAADVDILGQTMGEIKVHAGLSGLQASLDEHITVKLGPLGSQRIKMNTHVDINANKQEVKLEGAILGRILELTLDTSKLHINSPAICATPFEIKATANITPTMNIQKLLDLESGVNVDPSKIAGCIGAELEAALNKISNEYTSLSGYTATQANQALKQIADNAAVAAAAEYQRVKSIARNAANANPSSAMNAFNSVGNALKGFGKKKHKHGNNRLSPRVFDWDYYYDHNPDVVNAGVDLAQHWNDHGFKEDRKGSNEFHLRVYRALYEDVHGDYDDILNHWLGAGGLSAGRTASTTFSVKSLLRNNPSLDNHDDWQRVFELWLNRGESNWFAEPGCSSEFQCKYR